MRHQKIIKRDEKKYLIVVDFNIHLFSENPKWIVQVWFKEGRKGWVPLPETIPEPTLNRFTLKDQEERRMRNILHFVTAEEILSVKLELWNKIKPV